jgi:signal transduction histidine kinase
LLTTDVTAAISADRGRLEQLLENLFGNALAHGRADAHVRVGELSDGFYVEDDGPGIPEDTREHVFDAGFSTSAAGTGFGLSIVESIAHAHGWDVAVTDGTDGGARFEFTNVSVLE